MRFLILVACAAALFAAETEPKAQAKALWTAALKAGEPWTCLQLEAWGRAQKPAVRLGSALGESLVVGEALSAFPAWIETLADLGERIVVTAGERAYVVAADGRPLQLPVPVPGGWNQTLGYEGKALGAVERQGGELRLVAVRLGDGVRTISTAAPLAPTQSRGEGCAVADDGSALAVEVVTEDPETGRNTVSTLVATAQGGAPRRCELPTGLGGIGRNAAWLLAGEAPSIVVLAGDRRRQAVAAAAGPGLAACVSEGQALLIRSDGSEVALAGAPAIGGDPGMATVGAWLVLGTGSGAKARTQGDLLGDGGEIEVEQAPTLAFWRWADLSADPAAKPVTTMPGSLSVAALFPAAVWGWDGRQLDLINLGGREPQREPYLQAASPIAWPSASQHCVRLYQAGGRYTLYGPDKVELWSGTCARIEVKRRDLALIERRLDGHYQWSLVTLSADPAKRTEVRLELPDQDQHVRVSSRPPDVVVSRGERSWWRSVGFDGKVIETARGAGPKAVPAPRCPEWSWSCPPGRFQRDTVRLRTKADEPAGELLANLELADAWRIAGSSILLEQSGRVLVSGRKRGEWIELPAVAPADRLALAGANPVLAAGDELRSVAALTPGPRLEAREGLAALIELPGGPWRVEHTWRFTPPRSRQLEWDAERLGWRPRHLRSPEASGLFIVTPAVLIELDPAAARLFGK